MKKTILAILCILGPGLYKPTTFGVAYGAGTPTIDMK